jgi:hypothetical protein
MASELNGYEDAPFSNPRKLRSRDFPPERTREAKPPWFFYKGHALRTLTEKIWGSFSI